MIKYKKSLTLSLSILLVSSSLTLPVSSYANDSIPTEKNEYSGFDEELDTVERAAIIEEIFEIGNVKYYFKDTPNYTITVEMDLNGDKSVSYNDKEYNTIYFNQNIENDYVEDAININDSLAYTTKSTNTVVENNYITELKQVEEDVLNNKINLKVFEVLESYTSLEDEYVKYSQEESLSTFNAATKVTQSQLIFNLLTKEIGAEFTNKHLAKGYYKNYTGNVYQSRIFSGHQKQAFLTRVIQAGTGLGVAMSMLSLPRNKIMRLLTFGVSATGAVSLLITSPVKSYNAYVTYTKTAKVGQIYPYRTFKEFKTVIHALTTTAESTGYVLSYENTDYTDNNAIIRKGIDNYIKFH